MNSTAPGNNWQKQSQFQKPSFAYPRIGKREAPLLPLQNIPIRSMISTGFPVSYLRNNIPRLAPLELVERVKNTVKKIPVGDDPKWGLDHGTWSVLCRMYPAADIPVVQLSLNRERNEEFHYALGRELVSLRDEGVLILGSGNMVHNLRVVSYDVESFDWAEEYDAKLRDWILAGEHDQVVHYERHGKAAALAVNSAEHYLPLLYVLGASEPGDAVSFYCEKVTMGSISMRCMKLG